MPKLLICWHIRRDVANRANKRNYFMDGTRAMGFPAQIDGALVRFRRNYDRPHTFEFDRNAEYPRIARAISAFRAVLGKIAHALRATQFQAQNQSRSHMRPPVSTVIREMTKRKKAKRLQIVSANGSGFPIRKSMVEAIRCTFRVDYLIDVERCVHPISMGRPEKRCTRAARSAEKRAKKRPFRGRIPAAHWRKVATRRKMGEKKMCIKKFGGLIRESNPGHSHIRFSSATRSEYRTTGPISLV